MRIEIENNRTPLNEFIASIRSQSDSVELTRDGEVIAEVKNIERGTLPARKSGLARSKERAAAAARGWNVMDEARENVKKTGLTQRQIDRKVDRALAEVREQHDSRGR